MSEENKSAIVENAEPSASETSKFNPIAFGDTFNQVEEESTENVSEATEESVEMQTEETDDWSFEDEPVAEETKSGEDTARDDVNWAAVAAQLGLDGKSTKEEIQEALKAKQEEKENVEAQAPANEFDQLKGLLGLDDKGLMIEELKARGFGDAEVEDYIDRLEDNGTLKYEALKVRNEINKHIVNKETEQKELAKQQEAEKAKQVEENKIALQKTIKEREDFYGFNLGKEQKKEVYKYITSGDFYKDLSSSHEEVFEQAMFKLFKERVFALQSKKGYEDGKSQILDNITSPDLGRTSKPRAMKPKAFDPSQFSKS